MNRSDQLTTIELFRLDRACGLITAAFGTGSVYLVGTAGIGGHSGYRDVDVRLILDDDEFDVTCPTRERWALLCLTIGAWLRAETGLPVDFQVQQVTTANDRHGGKPRNPLGMRRSFANGGDGTPPWP